MLFFCLFTGQSSETNLVIKIMLYKNQEDILPNKNNILLVHRQNPCPKCEGTQIKKKNKKKKLMKNFWESP